MKPIHAVCRQYRAWSVAFSGPSEAAALCDGPLRHPVPHGVNVQGSSTWYPTSVHALLCDACELTRLYFMHPGVSLYVWVFLITQQIWPTPTQRAARARPPSSGTLGKPIGERVYLACPGVGSSVRLVHCSG
jgi:hypothetical protein